MRAAGVGPIVIGETVAIVVRLATDRPARAICPIEGLKAVAVVVRGAAERERAQRATCNEQRLDFSRLFLSLV